MTLDVEDLLHDAKRLEHDELAGLVHELLRVLDDDSGTSDATIKRAWTIEAERRLDEIESDSVRPVDGRETLALARAELAKRRDDPRAARAS